MSSLLRTRLAGRIVPPLIKEVVVRNGSIMKAHRFLCTGNTNCAMDSSKSLNSEPQQPVLQTTWNKIIIGEIKEIRQHPNADHLNVCQVSIGDDNNLLQIICGASNVIKGARVPVAMIGSKLALKDVTSGESKLLKIKKSKLRGEVSQGMICSEAELGLTANSDGILILEDDALVGSLVHQWHSIATRFDTNQTGGTQD